MSWLEDLWWRDRGAPPLAAPLALAEALFRAAAAGRDAWYRAGLGRTAFPAAAVVSIGNLVVGGAGKTPVTLAIAERLRARRRRVAILSRGYGARRRDTRVVADGERLLLDEPDAGDEPYLLARRAPGTAVLCGPRRVELATRAVALGADALVLDDGFQHRALGRDLDVVVLDAAAPRGNGRLLPRGPNREPWSALRRADLAWLSRVDQASPDALRALRVTAAEATGRAAVESVHAAVDVLDGALRRSFGPEALSGHRVLALSALARPEGFRATVRGLGAEIAAERSFRDHHRFTPDELEETLAAASAAGCAAVVTTEKDAVRIPPAMASDPRWRVVRISARLVAGAEALDALLDGALARGDARRSGRAEATGDGHGSAA